MQVQRPMHDGCDCTVPGTCLVFVVAVQWVLDRGGHRTGTHVQSGRGRFLDSLGQTVSSGAGAPTWLLMQFNSVVTDI